MSRETQLTTAKNCPNSRSHISGSFLHLRYLARGHPIEELLHEHPADPEEAVARDGG